MKKYTIVLDEYEKVALEKILRYEFDQEEIYQLENGENDISILKAIAKILTKIWKAEFKPNKSLMSGFIFEELVKSLDKRIDKVANPEEITI